MSETKSQPLTEGQKAIFDSIPVLHPAVMSIEDRFKITEELTTLRSQVATLTKERDECRAALVEAVKALEWRSEPPECVPGKLSDYFLCYTIDNDSIPVVLVYIYADKQWTSGGGDTQKVSRWIPIPHAKPLISEVES